jgi:hypothetical protein
MHVLKTTRGGVVMFSGLAALGAAAVFLAAPSSLTVTPGEAAPGATVTVQGGCDKALRSDALETVTLKGQRTIRVKASAKPGSYPVSMKCGQSTVKTTFKVLDDSAAAIVPTASDLPSASPDVGTFILGGVALLATVGAGFFGISRLRKET